MPLHFAGGADPGLPLDGDARMDHRVRPDFDVRADVGRRRVDQGHAGGHQFFVLLLSHKPAHFRQFGAAVDPADFLRILDQQRLDRHLAPVVNRHEVGQVELALGVLRGDPAQGVEEGRQIEGVDPAVDFGDVALGRGGVAFLDNPGDAAVAADDAAVAVGTFEVRGDHRGGRVCSPMRIGQSRHRRGRQHRNVTREQDDHALLTGQDLLGLLKRVSGTKLGLLHYKVKFREATQMVAHDIGTMAHDQRDAGGVQRPRHT
jgi:hypothetical protein